MLRDEERTSKTFRHKTGTRKKIFGDEKGTKKRFGDKKKR